MMGMTSGNVPVGYKVIKIRNPQQITLGDGLFNLLSNAIPTTTFALGLLDCEEFPAGDANAYMFSWDGTSNSIYFRTISGEPDAKTSRQMTNVYACKVAEGATFTVYYR